MNQRIQQLLDIPQKVNVIIKTNAVNTGLDDFDSNAGIRSYTAQIYKWAAFIGFVAMEVSILKAAYAYFTGGGVSGLAMVGSILTTLVLLASAFPIAKLIMVRGESLGSGHQGMVHFIFGDFIKTNIRLLGELAAIAALFAAVNQTISFLLDQNLFAASTAGILDFLGSVSSVPVTLLNTVLDAFHLSAVSEHLSNASAFRVASGGTYNGDFIWNTQDLLGVVGAYINVMIGLAFVYVNLAIYTFLFNLASTLINWIASPSIPLSVKNK